MAGYTNLMDDLLYKINIDEEAEDYSALIESWNGENGTSIFRTFGDALLDFIQCHNPDDGITVDNVIGFITKSAEKQNVPLKDIASPNTLKNWFKKGLRPDKGDTRRTALFALAFALDLNIEHTQELFHKVHLDRAFDYRKKSELIYYYAIANGRSWSDAKELIALAEVQNQTEDTATEIMETTMLRRNTGNIDNDIALLEFLKEHDKSFEYKNITAKRKLDELFQNALISAGKEVDLKASRELRDVEFKKIRNNPILNSEEKKVAKEAVKEEIYSKYSNLEKYNSYDMHSRKFLYEVITGYKAQKEIGAGTCTLGFKNSGFPEEIRSRFPEAGSLSSKNLTYEQIRKWIILLWRLWLKSKSK